MDMKGTRRPPQGKDDWVSEVLGRDSHSSGQAQASYNRRSLCHLIGGELGEFCVRYHFGRTGCPRTCRERSSTPHLERTAVRSPRPHVRCPCLDLAAGNIQSQQRRCEHSRISPLGDQVVVSLTHVGERKPQQNIWVWKHVGLSTSSDLWRSGLGRRRAGKDGVQRFSKLPASYLTVHMADVQPASACLRTPFATY